jgi:transposase
MAKIIKDMRVIRDILAYQFDKKLSQRRTAKLVGFDRTVILKVITRYQKSGLPWPIPDDVSDIHLREVIYPSMGRPSFVSAIDFEAIHLGLQQKGATLTVLHDEWMAERPEHNTLSYQQFCRRYESYRRQLAISMRRADLFGQVAYVDYSGMTMTYFDPGTMKEVECQVFIGVLGGSLYTFCEATHTQRMRDWLSSHARMFSYFGGVPRTVVPDNLKAAVTKADRFFPTINESYQAMCQYYGTEPFPARAGKPKDKPKAEAGVLLAQRWILFVLRKRKFFSLNEMNQEIGLLLTRLNEKKFQKKSGSRKLKWIEHELPALMPLPAQPYVVAEWGKVRAGKDYHVEIEKNFYSVPHRFRNMEIEYKLTDTSIELLQEGEVVACHSRFRTEGGVSTKPEHQPPNHRAVSAWSIESAMSWAQGVGEETAKMLEIQLNRSRNNMSGYRTTEGMKSLCKHYGERRLEEVCRYSLANGATSMKELRTILSKNLDLLLPQDSPANSIPEINHENIRGAKYYADILNTTKES